MWDVNGLEFVHGICNRRLVYSEVVEARSDYKKFYLQWFVNIVCYDATGSNQMEKDLVRVSPGRVLGKGGEKIVWFSVGEGEGGAPLVFKAPQQKGLIKTS